MGQCLQLSTNRIIAGDLVQMMMGTTCVPSNTREFEKKHSINYRNTGTTELCECSSCNLRESTEGRG